MSKRALVTGSAGLVGRHTMHRLVTDGWLVEQIDIRSNRIDARDFFRDCDLRYDLVVHCAAHVGGRTDIEGKPTYVGAVNLQLDGALFEWALRTRPAHVIYWSSSAVYPVRLQGSRIEVRGSLRRLAEADVRLYAPEVPDATYGWVKLTGERLAAEAQAEGLRVHVFRPFSGYAADQSLDYPFPSFIDRALRRADPFDVWGDGEQVRDFIHITDVVNGALAAIEQDCPGPLNLCSGRGVSFNKLAELVCHSIGYTPQILHRLDSPVGVRYRVGDPTEMLKVYTPQITLEQGIDQALEWTTEGWRRSRCRSRHRPGRQLRARPHYRG